MRRTGWCWIVAVVALAMLAGCGGEPEAMANSEGAAEAPAETPPSEMTPEELGKAIGDVYVESLAAVADLVEGRPEAAEVKPELETLKADTIERLVELGRQRETLSTADRATTDGATRRVVSSVPSPVFTAYAEGQNYYLSRDREVADLIASFNIITQYAAFELLKKQEPEEAERLGID